MAHYNHPRSQRGSSVPGFLQCLVLSAPRNQAIQNLHYHTLPSVARTYAFYLGSNTH
ncbi:hypothetical protein HMPREF1544_01144 [Mucor circinelloides 1006PhL]|uniref:Uncharacterized protein n=1 Tax=Mucor circinelloides f. circinelloides (strain 1006PhL) TaxID=1220926 RepID=S2KI33_MUCC1|nr:hypothetical protein HMPREF1544_01144 [Mucor circinelloides 1006PhL]